MISVVTPTYNRKEMLFDAIHSLEIQSYQDWEIVIVDDCSTDGTEEAVKTRYGKDSRIRYFKNEHNMGPGYNRGFGLKQTKGDFVVFMDDDDYYTDTQFFKNAMDIYADDNDKSLALVTANAYMYIVPKDKRNVGNIGCVGRVNGIDFLTGFSTKYKKPFSTFTSIFRKEALVKADLMSSEMVNDYVIYLRGLLYGDAYVLKECVGDYRIHDNNISFHITKDFLLQNAKERVWVKNKLLEVREPSFVHKWWNAQMMILAKYFYLCSYPNLKDALEVAGFIFKNSKFSIILYGFVIANLIIYKPIEYAHKFKRKIFGVSKK